MSKSRGANYSPLLLLVALALGVGAVVASALPADAEEEPGTYIVRKFVFFQAADGSIDATETVSAAFVVNAHRWAPSSMPVPVSYNGTGAPSGHDLPAILQSAIGTWNAVTPASFSFTWAGSSSGAAGACDGSVDVDGKNTVTFVDYPPGSETLGTTCTVWPAGGGSNSKLVEFDMELNNDSATWSSTPSTPGNRFDLPTTILHELGHAAGLGHSGDNTAVMYPSLPHGTQKRTLRQDDISGLLQAYPSSVTPAPAATSTPPATPTPTSTPSATPVTASPPPANFRVRAPLLSRD